ncbi:MAG: hypothetical protein PUC65_08340 [Clostridiales bacterium]|nr:hypothetical protein [Clostridiales bacterium]
MSNNQGVRKKMNIVEGADSMNATVTRPCTVQESLIQSCKEVKLMQEGKLPKKTWKEFYEERKKKNGGADQ